MYCLKLLLVTQYFPFWPLDLYHVTMFTNLFLLTSWPVSCEHIMNFVLFWLFALYHVTIFMNPCYRLSPLDLSCDHIVSGWSPTWTSRVLRSVFWTVYPTSCRAVWPSSAAATSCPFFRVDPKCQQTLSELTLSVIVTLTRDVSRCRHKVTFILELMTRKWSMTHGVSTQCCPSFNAL